MNNNGNVNIINAEIIENNHKINGNNVGSSHTIIHNDILDSPRTGSVLKIDDVSPVYKINETTGKLCFAKEFPATAQAHGFNDIVDNYAGYATITSLNSVTLYQLEGR